MIITIDAFISVEFFGIWWQGDTVLWRNNHVMEAINEVKEYTVP